MIPRSSREKLLVQQDEINVLNWAASFESLIQQIGTHFARAEARQRCRSYLLGLLSSVERKNGWQLAEYVGDSTPYGIQHLLSRARWDSEAVRDELQQYVLEHLSHPEAVVVIDETGFLKKGQESVGVQRQYTGTAGRIENCQIGVFLCYASPKGSTFIDRSLYLPKSWTEDRQRCQKAGVPTHVGFATKPQLARQMLQRAFRARLPIKWITADCVYGSDRRLRMWLETERQAYVMAVSAQESVCIGWETYRVRELAASTPENSWKFLSCGNGAKGPRYYEWVRYPLNCPDAPQWERWLLIRRHLTEKENVAYYIAYAPKETSLENLVKVAGIRWTVERCFQEAKGEVGLDHYEVRSWTGWHRHITLALFAHAFLSVMRAQGILKDPQKKGDTSLHPSSLAAFKRSRGL
jgi:SRSO17 transposase